ncbi:MAG TPA: AAA-associated domain-containing protein [Polyangia bacterium]|jgi:NitT/TauT family transport system ATP-binding protein|nr:AAA-associated domain-containing protein [Polyangia bacterium]
MPRPIEPLPSTGISKILGMCEILDDKGGREDLFTLARDLHMPFSEVLLVIKAAEMLALIDTPGHEAQLTAFGKKILGAPIHDKKAQLGEQMLKLNIFQHVVKLLKGSDRGQLPAELILEELALRLPHEQPRQMFTTLLNWGRYGDVFGYSRDTDIFFLHRGETSPAPP